MGEDSNNDSEHNDSNADAVKQTPQLPAHLQGLRPPQLKNVKRSQE